MKCVIIFATLSAIAFGTPLRDTDELPPCAPVIAEEPSEPELEATTLLSVIEQVSESQELPAAPERPVSTEVAEIIELITSVPSVYEGSGNSEASIAPETAAPFVEEKYATEVAVEQRVDEPAAETPAPTEATEELAPTTTAPFVAESLGAEAPVAPETPAPTATFEQLTVTPEFVVIEVSSEAPLEETPAPALRTPEVSQEPASVPEPETVNIIVIPLDPVEASAVPSFELPKPEETKPEEEKPKPEEPKPEELMPEEPKPEAPMPEKPMPENLMPEKPMPEKPMPVKPMPEEVIPEVPKTTRLFMWTSYDKSSKITSLKHFLEYLHAHKK